MRHLLLLLLSLLSLSGWPQAIDTRNFIVASLSSTVPSSFLQLRISNDSIAKNDKLNEEIVDLVNVDERDRKVPTAYTTHQGGVLGGWFIRMIGFYWKAIDRQRHRFVGTNQNGLSLPGEKDELTEHDVNFNLVPHLPQYLNLAYDSRLVQTKRRQFRRARHSDLSQPPFIAPTAETANEYDLHCELTPPKRLRDSVNVLFYPCMHGNNLDVHSNFCDMKPTVGLYGVLVLDCNHSCHPEIHPYEWLWWLRLTAEEKAAKNFNKNWMIGFFKESSNRFILWSLPPRVGTISVPFIFKTTETKSYLQLHELVKGKFRPHGISRMKSLPKETNQFNGPDTSIALKLGADKVFPLGLRSAGVSNTSALRWWVSDVQTDPENNWVWGYFNLVVSIKDGYTARLECVAAE